MSVDPLPDPTATPAGVARVHGAAPTSAAAPLDGVAAAAASPESAPTSPIAAAIAAGQLDASAAAERLVAATVASQRPPSVDPAAWGDVAREVSALLTGDPALEDLLRPL